jgi:tetraacyldisaccharide 4'-kinase
MGTDAAMDPGNGASASPPRVSDFPPVSIGLSLLSKGYRGLFALRETCYTLGLFRTRSLPCPVIAIGNLTVGGTGKTPAVELVARTLLDEGRRPAIISRGYRRSSRGIVVVSDGLRLRASPREAGDEPYLLARRLPNVPVVVGRHRYRAGRFCLDHFSPDALILDDAFQHRTLKKDCEILLVSGSRPWGNGELLPLGTLREPLSAMRRATLVVITHPQRGDQLRALLDRLREVHPTAKVLIADYMTSGPAPSDAACPAYDGRPLLAFCGIADPESFRRSLTDARVTVTSLSAFADHHWYTHREIDSLIEQARAGRAAGLITTEKDSVRLEGLHPRSFPLWILPIRLALDGDGKAWRSHLLSSLRLAIKSSFRPCEPQ